MVDDTKELRFMSEIRERTREVAFATIKINITHSDFSVSTQKARNLDLSENKCRIRTSILF